MAHRADFDPASRSTLEAALTEAGFVFVTAIRDVEEEVEIHAFVD